METQEAQRLSPEKAATYARVTALLAVVQFTVFALVYWALTTP